MYACNLKGNYNPNNRKTLKRINLVRMGKPNSTNL